MINPEFAKWATGHSGCDGGDIGSRQHPSIWFCGIEWGGDYSDNQELIDLFLENVEQPAEGYGIQMESLDGSTISPIFITGRQ